MMGWGCKPGGADAPYRFSPPLPRARGRTRRGRAGLRNGDCAGRSAAPNRPPPSHWSWVGSSGRASARPTVYFPGPASAAGRERAGGLGPGGLRKVRPRPTPAPPQGGVPRGAEGPTETTRPRGRGGDAGEAEDPRGTGETGPPRGASRPAVSWSGERGRALSPIPPRVQKADYGPHSPRLRAGRAGADPWPLAPRRRANWARRGSAGDHLKFIYRLGGLVDWRGEAAGWGSLVSPPGS